jgi:CheY-like chemotaxis protein
MNKKVLFVDDEPNILEGFRRTFRRDYDVHVAAGGEEALAIVESAGPFGVIVSDMRMPGMDGIQFFRRVKRIAPDSIKIMLTGNADQETAVNAVNEGSIFRFLTKPCAPEIFAESLDAGLDQYRLITNEKHLLEETLNKSLQVVVEILAIVNPTAFSRSMRVKKLARDIAARLGVAKPWEVEIAAMLSQIGCVTVPEEILIKVAHGQPLSDKETGLYHQHPQIGHDLIARIPRMETVAEIVGLQGQHVEDEIKLELDDPTHDEEVHGARILKVVLDYDRLLNAGKPARIAFSEMSARHGWYDPQVLDVLRTIIEISPDEYVELEVSVRDLKPGMVFDNPLLSLRGSMLLSAGQEITASLALRLINLADTGIIGGAVRVSVPAAMAEEMAVAA